MNSSISLKSSGGKITDWLKRGRLERLRMKGVDVEKPIMKGKLSDVNQTLVRKTEKGRGVLPIGKKTLQKQTK